jgi:hypothetical protein
MPKILVSNSHVEVDNSHMTELPPRKPENAGKLGYERKNDAGRRGG